MRYFNNHRRKLIKQNYIRGTKATAQGVPKLELENTVNLPPCKLEIHGKTEQKQYEGYNSLYVPSDFTWSVSGNNHVIYDSKTQIYDIAFESWGLSRSLCKFDTVIPAGTPYTILAEVLNDDFEITDGTNSFVIGLYKQDDTGRAWAGKQLDLVQLTPNNKIIKITGVTTLPTTDIWLFRNTSSSVYVKNLKVRFLVYFGTDEITEWEPYVGGTASPSASYPQPIESVHDFMLCYDLENDEHYMGALSCMVNDVHLLGIENAIDTLFVDYENKRVFKKERVLYKSVGELIDACGAEYDGIGAICINNDQPRMEISERNIPYYCTHFISYHNDPHMNESNPRFEVAASGQIWFYYPPLRSVEEFKAWCYENDVKIAYVLENEHQIDITNTEAGQNLLNLTLPEGESVIFEVNSKLPPKSMTLEYYSKTKEDKHKITVNYEDISGIQIKDSDEHFVRRDSLCKIISPNIDGYEPESESITVYAGNDMEITLIYNKK